MGALQSPNPHASYGFARGSAEIKLRSAKAGRRRLSFTNASRAQWSILRYHWHYCGLGLPCQQSLSSDRLSWWQATIRTRHGGGCRCTADHYHILEGKNKSFHFDYWFSSLGIRIDTCKDVRTSAWGSSLAVMAQAHLHSHIWRLMLSTLANGLNMSNLVFYNKTLFKFKEEIHY